MFDTLLWTSCPVLAITVDRSLDYMAILRLKQLWRSGITCHKILLLLMWEILFKFSWGMLIGNKVVTLDHIFISVTKCLSLLLAPLVGLLADVKFGRYEIIKTGSLVAFFASLVHYFALLLGEDASLLKNLLFCAATLSPVLVIDATKLSRKATRGHASSVNGEM